MPVADMEKPALTRKDFVPSIDVRWCPGCGDYAILNTMQRLAPELGIAREKMVFVSGIGCSSRFPYYMQTYGFHTIHGRGSTIATGIKVANPDLKVWLITGDGDGLSIGGNHLLHILRRNVDITILLFNNKIYGLTKGQYSPTSEKGFVKKSTPMGSLENPINPISFALSAEATFVARTADTNPKHMAEVFKAAAQHRGTSFIEILQNCIIYNNKAWEGLAGRDVRDDRLLMLEHGKPLIFGKNKNKGIRLNGLNPEIVTIGEHGITEGNVLKHDEKNSNPTYAYLLAQLHQPDYPAPMGVFKSVDDHETYEVQMEQQIKLAIDRNGRGNLQALVKGNEFWEITEDEKGETKLVTRYGRKDNTEEMDIMKEQISDDHKLATDPLTAVLQTRVYNAIREFGTEEALTISSSDSLSKAIEIMKKESIGSLPVVDNGKLVGIFTVRDILMKVVLKSFDRDHTPVSKVMTKRPETARHWNSIGDVINKCAHGHFRHIPIKYNDDKLGFISVTGLVSYIYTHINK